MMPSSPQKPLKPLRGVRVLSLALNLPGPAALMRLKAMGATCTKAEPPGKDPASSGDPMGAYNLAAYDAMHEGIKVIMLDLKTEKGQALLHRQLARTDVLLTSFRPSALAKLGMDWAGLHKRYPALSMIAIVGAPGTRAEEPGHDLTYLAEADLVHGLDLPATLYADMGGALIASEATLQAVLHQKTTGKSSCREVALSEAAHWLALPRTWGLTRSQGAVGGAHAGYKIYPCKNGRVAVAALEPHFAAALCKAAGLEIASMGALFKPETHQTIANFLAGKTKRQLEKLAASKDIPLHTLDS
jgi:crotonobetainyl-CoA:carnitine CoA-transferase CaiB-like acyl-CoA transferase